MIGRLLDSVIGVFAPGVAYRRASARMAFESLSTYRSAEKSRTTRDWPSKSTSADSALTADMSVINNRARAAVRDDWAASSIVQAYRRHVVGTGIHCRAIARDADGNPLDAFNAAANRLWKRYTRTPVLCDVEQRKTFVEMQGLLISEFATVGQSFVYRAMDNSQRGENPLRFQMFEPEQLDTTKSKNSETGNDIRNGIEVDSSGRAVAYWICTEGHPLDNNTKTASKRIPAGSVCHFMRQDRVRQTHGVTRLASVLQKLWHMGMYDQYQIVRAKYEAAIGMVIEQPLGGIPGMPTLPSVPAPETQTDGSSKIEIQPGMSPVLPPGYKAVFMQPTTPGSSYEPFMYQQLTEVAAGSGLDFATLTRDYSRGSFSAQRQSQIVLNQEIDQLQRLLIDIVLRPFRDEWVTFEILTGRLSAPGFFDDPEVAMRYLDAEWQPQPKPWIDPANQSAAAKMKLDYRLTTRAKELNELGESWQDTFDQIDDEQRYAESLNIALPEAGGNPVRNPREPIPGNQPVTQPTQPATP